MKLVQLNSLVHRGDSLANKDEERARQLLTGLGLINDDAETRGVAKAHALLQAAGIDISKAPRKAPSTAEVLVQLMKEGAASIPEAGFRGGQVLAKGVESVLETPPSPGGIAGLPIDWRAQYLGAGKPLSAVPEPKVEAIPLKANAELAKQNALKNQDWITQAAVAVNRDFKNVADAFAQEGTRIRQNAPEYLHQSLYDNPELLGSWPFMLYNIGSGAISMLPPITAGIVIYGVSKNPYAAAEGFAMAAASLEASGTYNESIQAGMSEKEATANYAKMFASVYLPARYLGTGGLFRKLATRAKPMAKITSQIVASMAQETGTEVYEELLGGALTGQDFMESLKQSVNVIPATIALSGLGGIAIAREVGKEQAVIVGMTEEEAILRKYYAKLGKAEQIKLDAVPGLLAQGNVEEASVMLGDVATWIDDNAPDIGQELLEKFEEEQDKANEETLSKIEDDGIFEGAAEAELTPEQKALFDLNEKKRELSVQGVSQEAISTTPVIVEMQEKLDKMREVEKEKEKAKKEEPVKVEPAKVEKPKVEPKVKEEVKSKVEVAPSIVVTRVQQMTTEALESIDQILSHEKIPALAVGKLKAAKVTIQRTAEISKDITDEEAAELVKDLTMHKVGIASVLTDIAAYDTNIKGKKQKIAKYKKTLDPKSIRVKGETISDFNFANISDGHASVLQYWQDLFEQNSLEPEQVAALKEMYAGRQVAEDIALEVGDAGARALGETSPFVPVIRIPVNILRKGPLDKGEGLTTFLHESLHAWLHHKASKTDADKARSIIASISSEERYQMWRDAGVSERSASYLTEDEEFMAHQFVLYTTKEYISPNKELNSIFDKVLSFIKQRIPFIEKVYPQVRADLAPFFEQVLGEKIEAKPVPKPKVKPKPKPPTKPKVPLRDYAELTNDPEALEVIAEDMVDFVKATDKAVVKDIVKWLQGQMEISEDDALDFIEDYGDISLLPPIEGITMDAVLKYKPGLRDLNEQGLTNAIATIAGRIADKTEALEEQQIKELDEELVDLTLQLDYAKRRLGMFKKGKAMEPVDTTVQPVNDSSIKKMGWREVRRKFRDIIKWASKYDQKTRVQAKEDLLTQFDKVVFPMMNKKTADPLAILRSIIDEVVFKELESVNVQIKNSVNTHNSPQLVTKSAIAAIRKDLDNALKQAAIVVESIEHLEDISEFSKAAVKADAEAITMQLVGIIDSLNESNLAQDYEDVVGALSRALNDVAAALPTKLRTTAQWIASPTSEVEALAESAGEARNKGLTMSQWRKSLPAEAKPNAKFGWRYALVSDTGGTQGVEMAHVKVSGQRKGRKGIFTTREMVASIARYKGPDLKVRRSKPIYYIFETMDKMMPGVGFAKLADRYQVALALHSRYTKKLLDSMTVALRGVNTFELGIYASVKDTPKMREYLISKGVKVDEIVAKTAANRKAMAAYDLGRQHFNDMWVAINKTRMRLGKDPIPYRSDYFTFIRTNDRLNQSFSDLINAPYEQIIEMFEESERDIDVRHIETTRFSFTERKPGPKPIELRYDRVFKTYTDIASKHMHFSPVITAVRELTGTMFIPGSEDSQQAVSLRHKGLVNTLSELERWADFLAGTKNRNEFGANVAPWVDKLVGRISNNVATYTMGFVLRTAIIQPTANYLTAINIGPGYFTGALKQWGAAHFKGDPEVRRRLSLSHHLPTRSPEATMDEIRNNVANLQPQNVVETLALAGNRLQSGAFFFIQQADMATAEVGWLAAFQYSKDNGLSDRQAATASDRLIAKTHGGSAPGLRAPIQRTAVGRALTLFQTFQLNEYWHLISELAFTDSMTIPGLEQAQDNINRTKTMLINKGVKEKDIESHPQMLAVRKRHGKLGRTWDADALKAERTRRIMSYLIFSALINSFYEDFIGINSPLPAPVRAAWQAYMKDDGAFQMVKSPILEFVKQIPVIGGGAYGGGLLGAGADYVDDVTDWMSGKSGAQRPAAELLGKTFGVPLLHQINKSIKSAENGGNLYEIAIGMYPGHRRMLIDIIALASGEDPYVE